MREGFTRFATRTAKLARHYLTFALAALVILVWPVNGPVFGFSDTWQPVINTGTTIVTFLMVFLTQNTQNRDALAVRLKLDEPIRATAADDALIVAERRPGAVGSRRGGVPDSASGRRLRPRRPRVAQSLHE